MRPTPLCARSCSVIQSVSWLVLLSVGAARPAELHVAVTGNDTHAGSAVAPFRTLPRAVAAAKAAPRTRTIIVHGGRYDVGEPVELDEGCSGTPGAPFTLRSAAGEDVIISGGAQIPAELFTAEALCAMLPATAVFATPAAFEPDAVFAAPDRLDFRIRNDAILPPTFPRIDFERIGLYLDEDRSTMPDKAAYREAVAEKYRGVRSHGGRYALAEINRRYSEPEYLKLVEE